MERESENKDLLLNRIFLGLNQSRDIDEKPTQLHEALQHLRQENDALRKTLRMHNGLRQRFEQLYDATPIGYLTISGNGCILEANLKIARVLGIQRSWLIGQNLNHYITDEDYRLFTRHLEFIKNHQGPDICNLNLINNNGEKIPVRMESSAHLGEPSSAFPTIYLSITPLEPTGQARKLTEQHADGRMARLKDDKETLVEEIKRHEDTEAALLQYQEQLDKLIKQKTKELEHLKSQLARETDERKQAEEIAKQTRHNLARTSRLNSVVDMAAGLAHEINQPLSTITTYTQSCLRKLLDGESPQRLQALLEQILVQTQRATHVIEHLRDFISNKEPHREATDIYKAVQFAVKMLHEAMITSDIKININQVLPVPPVMADPIQIEQVMVNFIQNAIDALKKVPANRRELDIKLSRTPTHACINIHDTGPGITQQNADKITKPFFTTKTNGMGLGLAISRTIIEDHGGHLIHKKSVTKGTTFLITLALNGQNQNS